MSFATRRRRKVARVLSYPVTGRGGFEKNARAPGYLFQKKFGSRQKG
jgi:hypothetical protein